MSVEGTAIPSSKKGGLASLVAAIYFLGGLAVVGYLSYFDLYMSPIYFADYLSWGIPFALLAIGYRRESRGILGWTLIVVGWLFLVSTVSNISSYVILRGQVVAIGKEIKQRALETQLKNETALEETGWHDFPDPDRLQADTGLEATREMLSAVRSLYERQEIQRYNLLDDWISAIRSLDGSPSRIAEYVSSHVAATVETEARMGLIKRTSMEVVLEAEKIVDFLARTPRSWVVVDGQLVFDRDIDARAYDQNLQRMESLAVEVIELHETLLKDVGVNLGDVQQE